MKSDVQAATVRRKPKGLIDHLGSGHSAFRAENWEEADRHFAKVLSLEPHHAEAAHMRGLSAHRRGELEQAATFISSALERDSTDPTYHYNLATTLQQLGREDASIDHLRRAVVCRPDHPKAYNNLGNMLRGADPKAAAGASRRALALKPDYAMAHNNLGSACRELKLLREAELSFKRCIVIDPQFALAYSNSCAVALDENRPATGAVSVKRSLVLDPLKKTALNMYGAALRRSGKVQESLAILKAAASLYPANAEITANLATTRGVGEIDENSQSLYRRAILCDPDFPEAHRNLGMLLLTDGHWAEGWAEYDWRLKTAAFKHNLKQPLWAGEELGTKRLLLHAEQGLGDTLQFCRYVSMASRRAKIALVVPPPLKRLLSGLEGVDSIHLEGSKLPSFDAHCPLLTLPRIFGTTENTVPPAPYLKISEAAQQRWGDRLDLDGDELKVGLVWAGSQTHLNDSRRSIPITTYLSLMDIPKVRWVSLQVGYRAKDYTQLGEGRLIDLSDELADFADTAAVIANLDLLISVDTSAVHLAGALGRPAWVLLPTRPDWRWQEGREDSPWYPSLRLFRQKEDGDWSEVADRVKAALSALAAGHRGTAKKHTRVRAAKALPVKGDRWSDLVGKALKDLQSKRLEEAGTQIRRILAECPDHSSALHVLGLVAHEQKRSAEAMSWIERALRIRSNFPDALYNSGVVLDSQRRYEESTVFYRRAVVANPQSQRAYCNLSNSLRILGQVDQAIGQGKRALALQPDYAKASKNIAMAQLLNGEWRDGWASYEARWLSGDLTNRPQSFTQPLWAGEPLDGKTLFIYAEQGLGDTLQFYPFAVLAAKRGPVVLEVQSELVSSLEGLPGIDRVIARGQPIPDFAYHAPLLSLPRIFGTTPETVPPRKRSLNPAPQLAEDWRKRIKSGPEGARIGVVWAGNPNHLDDHNRSIGIERLSPLFATPGVRWFSLQVGGRTGDLAAPGQNYPIEDLSKSLTDFKQTAAALRQLDLLITVDTSVCHLAGDLGVPTWLLLPAVPDWRWLQGRTDTPWYPSVRLFRQAERGDWGGVVNSVKTALEDWLKVRAPTPHAKTTSSTGRVPRVLQTANNSSLEREPAVMPRMHFIAGLPRSGSTLLSALLRQNPRFSAAVTSPLLMMCSALQEKMAGSNEFSVFFDDEKRQSILRGLFANYYRDTPRDGVVFDTNRLWTGRAPLLKELFPDFKIICCVREAGWILDSIERILRKNPLQLSRVFNFKPGNSIYGRAETLMNSETGLVGLPWTNLREAWFGDLADRLIIVPYDSLAGDPTRVMERLYNELGEPFFQHDFDNIDYDEAAYDAELGMPGLHKVRSKVEFLRRETCIPPDLFSKHANLSFWDKEESKRRGIVIL